jgi:hypothetical protein
MEQEQVGIRLGMSRIGSGVVQLYRSRVHGTKHGFGTVWVTEAAEMNGLGIIDLLKYLVHTVRLQVIAST